MALLMLLMSSATRAEQWAVENHVESRFELHDNYRLVRQPTGTVKQFSVSDAITAARQSETSSTSVNAGLTGYVLSGESGENRVDGQVGAAQSWTDLRDSYGLNGQFVRDSTQGSELTTTGIQLTRGWRNNTSGGTSWTHMFTERFSAQAQASLSRVTYERLAGGGADYRYATGSGGLRYALSEASSLDLQVSHSDYQTLDDTTRSRTDDFKLTWTKSISELMDASVGFGRYRTSTATHQRFTVCPGPVALCQLGFLPYQQFTINNDSTSFGSQYSASLAYRADEATRIDASLARRVSPSGASSVVESDSLSATLSRDFSPLTRASLNYLESRSRYLGVDNPSRPRYRSVGLSVHHSIASDLSMDAGYYTSRSRDTSSGSSIKSNVISLSLKYDWPRLSASH